MIHGCIEKYAQNENHIVLSSKSASKRNWPMFFGGMLGTPCALHYFLGVFRRIWVMVKSESEVQFIFLVCVVILMVEQFCLLKSISIKEGVRSIGIGAFSVDEELSKVSLLSTLRSPGAEAFQNTGMT